MATHKVSTWLSTLVLAWEAQGIIYGDIGTSPLYVFSTIFADFQPSEDDVLGAVGLIFWTLTLIVLIKYVGIVLLADDDGEGGTFSLYSLLCRKIGIRPHAIMFNGESRQLRNLSTRTVPQLAPASGLSSSSSGSAAHAKIAQMATDTGGEARAGTIDSTDSNRKELHYQRNDDVTAVRTRAYGDAAISLAAIRHCGVAGGSGRTQRKVWWKWLSVSGAAMRQALRRSRASQLTLWGMTMAATGMVIGDGVLTPAISVMSSVSGLKEATDKVNDDVVIGVSISILVLLFGVQRLGTNRVAFLFAPIVALWLASNTGVALYNLRIYGAKAFIGLSPHYIIRYFENHGGAAWRSLGSVMLCVTGAEALYADLGHFNRKSIMVGFVFFVYPCLAVTYIGQGAFLIHNPDNVSQTFWKCVPRPYFYPMLILATLASVVASQALITACFSIISNAIKLGAFPKLNIQHTSERIHGQIYIAEINWILMLLCMAVVVGFQDTVALGKAYGLSVSSVFILTTLLILVVMVAVWEVSLVAVAPFAVFFLALELAFLTANLLGVAGGGWFSLAVSASVVYVMSVWWAGSTRRAKLLSQSANIDLAELFVVVMQPPPYVNSKSSSKLATHCSSTAAPATLAAATPAAADMDSSPASRALPVASGVSPDMVVALTASTQAAAVSVEAVAPPAVGTPVNAIGALTPSLLVLQDASIEPPALTGTSVGAVGRDNEIRTATNSSGLATPGTHATGTMAAAPSSLTILGAVRARLSSWRAVQLALRLPDGQMWPLSRQPGIGLYYSETPVGLPHVMLHVLKNIQSMHDVSVFITVQYMPIPYVVPGERLLVRELRPIPNFYQVVARYGYLDKVDHGPVFIHQMVAAVVKALRRRCTSDRYILLRASTGCDDDENDKVVGIHMGHGSHGDEGGDDSDNDGDGREEEADASFAHHGVPQRSGVRLQQRDQSSPASGGGGVYGEACMAPPLFHHQQQQQNQERNQLQRPATSRPVLRQSFPVDENAIAHVLEAIKHGVVYYLGAVRVRAESSSPIGTQLLFGSLYRALLAFSHSNVEDWNLPSEKVVELGLVLRI